MTVQALPTDTAFPLVLTLTSGDTGLSPVVALRQGANWLDFSDFTFKPSGWTTRQAAQTEVSDTLAPGQYEYALDVSQLNAAVGDVFMVEYEITGSLYVSDMLVIADAGVSLDTTAIINAINAQTVALLAVYEPGTDCASPVLVTPSVYTGHKGDAVALPVYRGATLMADAELVGSTGLVVNFYNRDTDTNYQVNTAISVGSGFATYTTTTGDGVYETPGKWEAQAEGVSATGEPWRSQVVYTTVKDEVQ